MLEKNKSYFGFTLANVFILSGLGELVREFVHDKTKAKVYYIESSQSTKTFNLSFDTPCLDNTGVRHIIEHSVLCGSRKYRSKDPFRDISNTSMSTYMNAVTYPSYTAYPYTTNNEEDFFNLMDFYLDSVFNPLMISDKRIFEAEGWHYEVDDEDNISINGVVYNEMRKTMSDKNRVVSNRSDKDIFPDSQIRFISGGDPSYIPRLTFENFVKYYKKYYHPSNSCLVLYGDMNISKALCLLNYYYKQYRYKEYKENKYESTNAPDCHYFEADYPATSYEVKEDCHIVKLTYRLPNEISHIDEFFLDFITDFITMGANPPLKKNVVKAHLAERISLYIDTHKLGSSIVCCIEGVKKDDINKTISVARETLKDYLSDLDINKLKVCYDNFSFNYTNKKVKDYGLFICKYLTGLNNEYVDPASYDVKGYLDAINVDITDFSGSYFKSTLSKYVIDNEPYIHVFSPDISFGKRLSYNEKKRLANAKKKFNDDDIKQIRREQEALKAYRNRQVTSEELATIPKLKVSSLPKEIKWIDPEIVNISDIPIKYFDAGTSEIVTLRFYFDMYGLTKEEMKFAKIIADLIIDADTKKYSVTKMRDLADRLFLIRNRKLFISDLTGDYFMVEIECKRANLKEVMDLVIEIFKETMYNDESFLRERLKTNMNGQASLVVQAPQSAVKILLNKGFSRAEYIRSMWQSLDYIDLVTDLLNVLETKEYSLSGKLRRITKKICSKNRLNVTVITKDQDEIKKILAPKFITLSKAIDRVRQDKSAVYDLEDANRAIIINSMVNFVGIRYDLRMLNNSRYKKKAIAKIIRDEYLWDEVRLKGGAYGAICDYSNEGYLVAISYRDPEYTNTFKVLKRMCLFLENYDGDVTDAIISTYSEILKENSLYSVVDRVDDELRRGHTKESYIDDVLDLLSLTKEDIRACGIEMHRELRNAICAAASNESTILADGNRYATIYRM